MNLPTSMSCQRCAMTDLLDKDDKILLFSFGDSDFDPSGLLIFNQSAKK